MFVCEGIYYGSCLVFSFRFTLDVLNSSHCCVIIPRSFDSSRTEREYLSVNNISSFESQSKHIHLLFIPPCHLSTSSFLTASHLHHPPSSNPTVFTTRAQLPASSSRHNRSSHPRPAKSPKPSRPTNFPACLHRLPSQAPLLSTFCFVVEPAELVAPAKSTKLNQASLGRLLSCPGKDPEKSQGESGDSQQGGKGLS